MNEEILRKYQETISLLQFRNPKYSFHGEFVSGENGKIAFKLLYYKNFDSEDGSWAASTYNTKTFKYMNSSEDAIKYFIKVAQNRVF